MNKLESMDSYQKKIKTADFLKSIFYDKLFFDIIILTIGVCIFFNPIVFKNKIYSNSDFLFNWYPWAAVTPNSFDGSKDNYILSDAIDTAIPDINERINYNFDQFFNGYEFRFNWGMPSPSILSSSGMRDPLAKIIYRVIGLPYGLNIYIICKTLLGGIGFILFLNELPIKNRAARVFGSFSFMFSAGYLSIAHTNISGAYCLLPYCFLSAIKISENFNIRNIVFYTFFVVWIFFTGFPTMILYAIIFCFIYFIFLLFINDNKDKNKIYAFANFLFLNILIIGLLSFSILPNLVNINFGDLSYRENYGMRRLAIQHFPQLFYPMFCGNGITRKWICNSNWLETSTYAGLLPIAALSLSLFMKSNNKDQKFFFIGLLCFKLALIFNFGNINYLTNLLPFFNITSNTRLVFYIPFSIAILGSISLDDILSQKPDKKILLDIIYSLIFISVTLIILFLFGKEIIYSWKEVYYQMNKDLLRQDLLLYLYILLGSVISIGLYFLSIQKGKNWANNFLAIINLLLFLDLYIFSKGWIPYITSEEFFPITPGISFLQENVENEDRILQVGRVFLPNTNKYYGISSLSGHSVTTKDFKNAMHLIDINMFPDNGHGTYDFFDRETINLSNNLDNYFQFNRVKYIVQHPRDASTRFDIAFSQPHINYFEEIKPSKVFFLEFENRGKINKIKYWTKPYSCNQLPELSVLFYSKVKNDYSYLKNQQKCDEITGEIMIELDPIDINEGDFLEIKYASRESFFVSAYNGGRDIRINSYLSGSKNNEQKILIYYDMEKENFPIVYKSDDLMISQVYSGEGTAYYYSCVEHGFNDKDECLNALRSYENNLEEFNILFENLTQVNFINFTNGKIQLDLNGLEGSGYIIMADNYFPGWNSSIENFSVVKGFMGGLSVYAEEIEKSKMLELLFLNPYLIPGSIISFLSLIILLLWFFHLYRR